MESLYSNQIKSQNLDLKKVKNNKMENEKLRRFKQELENWVDFNSKSPMTLLDISHLISIIKQYYYLKLKIPKKKK